MKTTLELPDGLMQRVKLRAVHRNQKLKDAIAQLLELGMAAAPDAKKSPRVPKAVRLKGGRLDIVAIEAAIAAAARSVVLVDTNVLAYLMLEIAFFIGRNLPERMKLAMCGFLHLIE
jgi:hypothetical protein